MRRGGCQESRAGSNGMWTQGGGASATVEADAGADGDHANLGREEYIKRE